MINLATIDLKTLAFLIYTTLNEHGIEAVLVGGACVSIYSENRYMSHDLDFVTYEDIKKSGKTFRNIGLQANRPLLYASELPVPDRFCKPTDCCRPRIHPYF